MPTTTIRITDELKARVAAAAERAGKTSHSFILEAIAEKAEQAERRSDFEDVAEKRFADIVASGKTVPWAEMRNYLENRLAGKAVRRPARRNKRELVIGRPTRGYVALYRYVPEVDTVFILALRGQREAGYKHA